MGFHTEEKIPNHYLELQLESLQKAYTLKPNTAIGKLFKVLDDFAQWAGLKEKNNKAKEFVDNLKDNFTKTTIQDIDSLNKKAKDTLEYVKKLDLLDLMLKTKEDRESAIATLKDNDLRMLHSMIVLDPEFNHIEDRMHDTYSFYEKNKNGIIEGRDKLIEDIDLVISQRIPKLTSEEIYRAKFAKTSKKHEDMKQKLSKLQECKPFMKENSKELSISDETKNAIIGIGGMEIKYSKKYNENNYKTVKNSLNKNLDEILDKTDIDDIDDLNNAYNEIRNKIIEKSVERYFENTYGKYLTKTISDIFDKSGDDKEKIKNSIKSLAEIALTNPATFILKEKILQELVTPLKEHMPTDPYKVNTLNNALKKQNER